MMNHIIKFSKAILFIIIIFTYTNVFADLIKLTDGSVIQGKIIREDDRIYFFTNSYGTFEVKKVNAVKIFTTNSYTEDIEIAKKNNLKFNFKLAKKNYDMGVRKKLLMKKGRKGFKKYFEYWDYGRLSISVAYFATISEEAPGNKTINKRLPSGFSGHVTYEQGLDMLLYIKGKSKDKKETTSSRKYVKTKRRPIMMPGLRVEWSYIYFTKDLFVSDDKEVSGSLYTVGPMWSFPSPHNVWGCFILSVMPGISFIKVSNRETGKTRNGEVFALTAVFGYEYAINQRYGLLFHARYTYISDENIAFHGIGASFGLAFRLW